MIRLALIAVLGMCFASLAGCDPAASNSQAAPPSEGPLKVVATIGMVADVARTIAGDRAEVTGLVAPGLDPHLYQPTRDDMKRLLEGDLVFYNGLLLEGKMTDALIRAASSGRRVVAVTESIDESALLEPEEFEGHFDPHVWMDPAAWAKTVPVIRDALIALDPEGAATYRTNAETYASELAELDRYAETVLATVSERSRVLITAHDAFNYLGRRFGYEVVGIQGISTASEAGVRDVERLVDMIVDRDVRAVFVETTVSDRNVQALIRGARARGHEVVIGGELFSDAMGNAGAYEGTYVGMIDHNVTTIARALGGEAPDGGMNGKLAN